MKFKTKYKIFIWDNDGTVTGAKDPHDTSKSAKIILPGVKITMDNSKFNFIISGCKTPESETKNFDPEEVSEKFIKLMEQLPVSVAIFSPKIGGVECYAVIKKLDGTFVVKQYHVDLRYKEYIGKFKKPDIGMFIVLKDIAKEEFGEDINIDTSIMIGDTWHDKIAAESFGISFLDAKIIHENNMKF